MTLDIEKMKAAALAATQGIWAFGSFHRLLVVPVSDDGHHDKNSPIADLGETEIPWDATEDSKTRYNNAIHIATANPQAVLELINFYHKAQREALEQAAKVCEKKWRKEDSFDSHANAKAIRQLIKE